MAQTQDRCQGALSGKVPGVLVESEMATPALAAEEHGPLDLCRAWLPAAHDIAGSSPHVRIQECAGGVWIFERVIFVRDEVR